MQVNNISNNNCYNNYNCNKKNAKTQRQNFGNALVSSVAFIENNGFIGEFFTVDAFGMAGPRTIQAYMRNREELGHLNHKAGREEAIREVLTGPSLFIIPMGLVLISGKLFGRATKINVATMREFKKISKNVIENHSNIPKFNRQFYDEALSSIFTPHAKAADTNGTAIISRTKNEIIEALEQLKNKELKKAEVKKLRGSIIDKIIQMNHLFGVKVFTAEKGSVKIATNADVPTKFTNSLSPQNIALGKKSEIKDGIETVENGISKTASDFIDDLINYTQDKDVKKIASKTQKEAQDFLDKTHGNKEGIRKFLTTLSYASVGAFLYSIPMFYKRNKQFPGIDGLVEGQTVEPKDKRFSNHKKEIPK